MARISTTPILLTHGAPSPAGSAQPTAAPRHRCAAVGCPDQPCARLRAEGVAQLHAMRARPLRHSTHGASTSVVRLMRRHARCLRSAMQHPPRQYIWRAALPAVGHSGAAMHTAHRSAAKRSEAQRSAVCAAGEVARETYHHSTRCADRGPGCRGVRDIAAPCALRRGAATGLCSDSEARVAQVRFVRLELRCPAAVAQHLASLAYPCAANAQSVDSVPIT